MKGEEVEYEQAILSYRFFHEYRMRTLNFCIALNAAMLVVVVQHVKSAIGQMMISLLAVMATLAFLGMEIRTIQFANRLWSELAELEKKLGYNTMTRLWDFAKQGTPQRYYVRALYGVILVIWVVVTIASGVGAI